jgi:amphi-Trp domain-containing protein
VHVPVVPLECDLQVHERRGRVALIQEGEVVPEFKFEKKEVLSRKQAAGWLSAIAKALGSDGSFELEREGEKLSLYVADDVKFELEVEIKDDETELEIELKWPTTPTRPEPPKRVAPAKRTRRRRASPT